MNPNIEMKEKAVADRVETLTVGELIDCLKQFEPETKIATKDEDHVPRCINGYWWGVDFTSGNDYEKVVYIRVERGKCG